MLSNEGIVDLSTTPEVARANKPPGRPRLGESSRYGNPVDIEPHSRTFTRKRRSLQSLLLGK